MSRSTLIMIHGFRGTHHGLELIAKDLGDFTTIIPDLPGFGDGPHLDSYSLDSYVQWLDGFIKEQKLSEVPHLLGHSFGSIICAAYAERYPGTIASLILVNPIGSPALEGPRGVLSRLAVGYYWFGKALPTRLAKAWLSSKPSVMVMSVTMAKTKNTSLRRFIHQQHLDYFSLFHSPKSVYEGFITSVNNTVKDFASGIRVRTLLIAGEQDDITPIDAQRELHTLFPQAQLIEIKDVGHLTHYETPKEVAKAVQAFITVE